MIQDSIRECLNCYVYKDLHNKSTGIIKDLETAYIRRLYYILNNRQEKRQAVSSLANFYCQQLKSLINKKDKESYITAKCYIQYIHELLYMLIEEKEAMKKTESKTA